MPHGGHATLDCQSDSSGAVIPASALASSHGHTACTEYDISLPFCVIEGVRRTSPHLAARLEIHISLISHESCVSAVIYLVQSLGTLRSSGVRAVAPSTAAAPAVN